MICAEDLIFPLVDFLADAFIKKNGSAASCKGGLKKRAVFADNLNGKLVAFFNYGSMQ